ncbi:MAG: hypothetical protein AAF366_11645 [Pseudomonadota bacterium]
MNVCTMIASGPLDVDTFLFVVGMGITAIALSFAKAEPRDDVEAVEA